MSTTYQPHTLQRWTYPGNYAGKDWPEYYGAGFGQHRDSDALARSNFQVTLDRLAKLPPFISTATDDDGDPVISREVIHEGHWAVGWVEWIAIHESDTAALMLCDELAASVQDYPVLDDEHFSAMEDEEAQEVWRACYNPAERLAYVRQHRGQFEFSSMADLLGCIRGRYFAGYASELLS